MTHHAFISLGSNIEPERHLRAAVLELKRLGDVAQVSRVYESKAVGDPNQPDFMNAAVLLKTDRTVEEMCDSLRQIESMLGRVRDPENKNAARTIDLDLVLFDDAVLTVGHRRIPDPDILERAFVAVPLSEVAPEFIHPETGQTLREIAERMIDQKSGLTERLAETISLLPL